MALAWLRGKDFRLASYKGGFVCAIDQYICLALRKTGANFDVEIARGGVVKDGQVVGPTIYDKYKVAVDGRAACCCRAHKCISTSNCYGISAAGARGGGAADDAEGGVRHGQPGRQTGSGPVIISRATGGAQRHGERQALPCHRVIRCIDGQGRSGERWCDSEADRNSRVNGRPTRAGPIHLSAYN